MGATGAVPPPPTRPPVGTPDPPVVGTDTGQHHPVAITGLKLIYLMIDSIVSDLQSIRKWRYSWRKKEVDTGHKMEGGHLNSHLDPLFMSIRGQLSL